MNKEKRNKIKVVIQLSEKRDVNENELERNRKDKLVQKTKDFFDNYFKNQVCDCCKEESKGTVIVELYNNGSSAILDYIDFCCFDFMRGVKKIPK